MPTTEELVALADKVYIKNYRQPPFVLERGQGAEVWDKTGRRFLDMTAGIAVCGLGHAHPEFTARMQAQLGKLVHVSNLFHHEPGILAAAAIVERSFADRVYFCNSGAEANESAMKLARRYADVVMGEPGRTAFVATNGSFHGRTMGAVAITGQHKYREHFGPLVEPVRFVNFGDLAAAEAALADRQACAFIVEPIQAEGGIMVAPPGYLAGLRKLCDATGTLLIFDEVQTGMGRTGSWFGHQHDGVTPDVMTLAKGLGGGIPIGAIAVTEKAAQGLTTPAGGAVPHASTFGGQPFACAAAVAVFDIIAQDGLLARVSAGGDRLAGHLAGLVERFPGHALEARGRGLLRGLAVAGSPVNVVARARELGVMFSVAGANVVRFAPPFVATEAHLDEACDVLGKVLAEGVGKA